VKANQVTTQAQAEAVLKDYRIPYYVVMNMYKDPKTKMAFNWFTNTGATVGRVEIVQGTTANHADFAQPLKTIRATANTRNDLTYNVQDNDLHILLSDFTGTVRKSYMEHKALAEDLSPGTTYSFRVGDDGYWSDIGTFTTTETSVPAFTFLYSTDPQSTEYSEFQVAKRTTDAAYQRFPDVKFWINCGDHVDNDVEWEWEQFFVSQQNVLYKVPFAPVMGNHDVDGNDNSFQSHFNTPLVSFTRDHHGSVYSFVYGDVLFLALGLEDFSRSNYLRNLTTWIREEVANHPDVRWRIAFFHRAIYTGANHQDREENKTVREAIAPVLDELGIDLAIQGHDHVYEVIGPVYDKALVPGKPGDPGTAYDQVISTPTTGRNYSNVTGKSGGKYNTEKGTLYFLNSASGVKNYDPNSLTSPAMTSSAITGVTNYYSLFTGRLAQPGRPTYSNVSVTYDEITIKTYTVSSNGSDALFDEIKVVKSSLPSSNANLSSLTVSEGTLTPTFNVGQLSYNVTVANSVQNIIISANAQHAKATVTGDTGDKTLAVGDNTFSVTVTAEDGTTKTYTITIIRAASDEVTLKNLTVSSGVLSPSFASHVTEYNVNVTNNITAITVTGEPTHPSASVTGNVTGRALEVGENKVILIVTAEDGVTTKTYTITIIRDETGVISAEDIFTNNLNIYPNPFTSALHITNAEGYFLWVFNVADAVVHTQKLTNTVETLRLERLPSGVYFFRLENDEKSKTIRVVRD